MKRSVTENGKKKEFIVVAIVLLPFISTWDMSKVLFHVNRRIYTCGQFVNCLKQFGSVRFGCVLFSSSCLIQMKRFGGYQNQWKIKFCRCCHRRSRVFHKIIVFYVIEWECGMWKGALIQEFIDRLGYQQKDTDTDTSTLPLPVNGIEMNDGHDIFILFLFISVSRSLAHSYTLSMRSRFFLSCAAAVIPISSQ